MKSKVTPVIVTVMAVTLILTLDENSIIYSH